MVMPPKPHPFFGVLDREGAWPLGCTTWGCKHLGVGEQHVWVCGVCVCVWVWGSNMCGCGCVWVGVGPYAHAHSPTHPTTTTHPPIHNHTHTYCVWLRPS